MISQTAQATNVLLHNTPLKKLDPALLTVALLNEANRSKMNGELVFEAISFAALMHEGQTRANRENLPRTPYIEHPLRNAIRVLRWECSSQDVVLATILHDVVEDCSRKFVKKYKLTDSIPDQSEASARQAMLDYISDVFGEEVARVVNQVSNPIPENKNMTREEKHLYYFANVVEKIRNDPNTLLVKFTDFVDNATGLYHNDFPAKFNLARKYRPLVAVFREEIKKQTGNLNLDEKHISQMLQHLDSTATRLQEIIDSE